MQKVTENYLSKVTRYFYFVTSQHLKRHITNLEAEQNPLPILHLNIKQQSESL